MSTFSAKVSSGTPSTTADTMTLTPASARRIWITELMVAGMGTSSAASEIGIFNVTVAGSTPGGALTPTPWDHYSNTVGTTVNTTWGTQPTIGNCYVTLPVNANGGIYRWVARPGQELNFIGGVASPGFAASIRAITAGGGNYSIEVTWIEDPI